MILLSNPVIANMVVRLYGKGGATKLLGRARTIIFRPRGRSDLPWQRLDVSKLRKNIDKQNLILERIHTVQQEQDKENEKARKEEEKAEKERIKKLERSKHLQTHKQIRFKPISKSNIKERAVRDKNGKLVRYVIYDYELKKLLKFVSGKKGINVQQLEEFLFAVTAQAKEVFRKHGRTWYYIRTTHRYHNLAKQKVNGKLVRFDGMSAPRFKADAISDFDSNCYKALLKQYLNKMMNYLKHANASTAFDFLGFTIEVTRPKMK